MHSNGKCAKWWKVKSTGGRRMKHFYFLLFSSSFNVVIQYGWVEWQESRALLPQPTSASLGSRPCLKSALHLGRIQQVYAGVTGSSGCGLATQSKVAASSPQKLTRFWKKQPEYVRRMSPVLPQHSTTTRSSQTPFSGVSAFPCEVEKGLT